MNPAHEGDSSLTGNGMERPNGGAAAAILAAGAGCFCVSLFAILGDAIPAVARFFTFYTPTGPLSGVTTSAIAVWLVLWAALGWKWSGRTLSLGKINALAFGLLALGFLLSFPPLADLVQGR